MTWNITLTQLRDVLAGLYPREEDSRRIAVQADLNTQHIAFNSMAINNWQAIIEEAQKQGKTEDLILVAINEYPKNKPLLAAVDAYRDWAAQNRQSKTQPQASFPTRLSTPQKMQLVNALLQCQTVSDRQTRDAVVNDLPDNIEHNIQRSPNNRVDVVNIVTTALNYSDGLKNFIELVRMYEGDSLGMQEVDGVLTAVSPATANVRTLSPANSQQEQPEKPVPGRDTQRRNDLEEEYDLLSEKINQLRRARIIETDVAVKFKLDKHIEAAEKERQTIETKLR